MQANVGGTDRIVRIVLGVALILFALFSTHPLHHWGWLGVVFLGTGLFRWCPAYLPFGFSTCKTK
jgi:hypothetical protein